ncbi:MAG: EAL domain-containing protein [Burkholderiaceae bacterium]|nr:EAL domain-containing protein [Burkholderiaceae bacterium]
MNARRITVLYLLFGGIWILLSDRLLAWLAIDVEQLTGLQSVKGLAFVLLSGALVHLLVRLAERRHRELEARTQRERDHLAQMLDAAPAALYALQPASGSKGAWEVAFVGPSIERLTGHAPACWTEDPDFWRRQIHPEDLDDTLRWEARLLQEGSVRHEYRVRRADGSHLWVHDRAVLQRAPDGRPLAVVGVWLDVTARRQAGEHADLIAQVFDDSQEGIFITDAQQHFLSVNRTFTQVTGYTESELAGRTPALLKSGRQDADFYRDMWERLAREGRWEGEIWNRRKSGEVFPEWLTISAIQGPDGQVRQYLGIFTETTGSKAAEARIQRLANYDPLTGLPNRNLLADRAEVALAAARSAGQPLLLLHLNIDRFGSINESLGHAAGDQVLREIGRRLSEAVGPESTLCRVGGDDFVLLHPGAGAAEVPTLGLRLLDAVAAPLQVGSQAFRLSASIGVAVHPDNGADLVSLRQAAEAAVHQAKREGHGQLRIASKELQERVQASLELANELRWALERQQLSLHFQPQFDAADGRLVGCEALLRWNHPRLGAVSPARFIPIAEEAGLIAEIGRWVMREAIARNAAWQAAGRAVVPVAINLSAVQFRDPALCDDLRAALQQHGLAPQLLELELTESIAMEDSEFTVGTVAALEAIGVQLSIDDFGTGYSSLNYLRRFAVHKLKIDQSFVRGLTQHGQDEVIVSTIIGLAHNLGLRTIAEGVETEPQRALLRRLGCDELQGYLTGRPMPPEAFEPLLGPLHPTGS